MTLREKIEVMQAFERGEEIEVSYVKQAKWTGISNPDWSWGAYNYRIKPKLKQVIVLETWLMQGMYQDTVYTYEASPIYFEQAGSLVAIKLLSTREVEL